MGLFPGEKPKHEDVRMQHLISIEVIDDELQLHLRERDPESGIGLLTQIREDFAEVCRYLQAFDGFPNVVVIASRSRFVYEHQDILCKRYGFEISDVRRGKATMSMSKEDFLERYAPEFRGEATDRQAEEDLSPEELEWYKWFNHAREERLSEAAQNVEQRLRPSKYDRRDLILELEYKQFFLDFMKFLSTVNIEEEIRMFAKEEPEHNEFVHGGQRHNRRHWELQSKLKDIGFGPIRHTSEYFFESMYLNGGTPSMQFGDSKHPEVLGPLDRRSMHIDGMAGFYISYKGQLLSTLSFTPSFGEGSTLFVNQLQGGTNKESKNDQGAILRTSSADAFKLRQTLEDDIPEIILFSLAQRFAASRGMRLALRKPHTIHWQDFGERVQAGESTLYDRVGERFGLRDPSQEERDNTNTVFSGGHWYSFPPTEK